MNANGVTRPVRPTLTRMSSSLVVASSGGYLKAIAQRGAREVEPSRRCSATSSTLTTTPSISCSMSCRCSPQYAVCATTSSTPVEDHRALGDRQPPGAQRGVALGLALQGEAGALAEAVADQPQVPRRGDPRVLLPQRTGRGVARVGERRLARGDQRGVQRLEVRQPEVDLAAHLDQLRHRELGAAGEPVRHLLQGAHVQRDVLAGAPVAAGQRADQRPVLVEQVHRQPVDLELAEVVHLLGADLPGHPLGPLAQRLLGERVVQAEHALQVVVRDEVGGEPAADLLRRRLGRDQLRVALLQPEQLLPQLVELAVGDGRVRTARSSGTGGRRSPWPAGRAVHGPRVSARSRAQVIHVHRQIHRAGDHPFGRPWAEPRPGARGALGAGDEPVSARTSVRVQRVPAVVQCWTRRSVRTGQFSGRVWCGSRRGATGTNTCSDTHTGRRRRA